MPGGGGGGVESNSDNFFLVYEGRREDPNTTKSRSLSARQRNAI